MSSGPIDHVRYGQIDKGYALRLATTPADEDGPVWMVNLMKYREVADYADGRKSTISGREADDVYAPFESLAAVGAEIVFVGDVEDQLLGDETVWDRVAVVKYPTRRSFIEMQSRPEFGEKHAHKDAGMAQTFVIGCQPLVQPELPADAPDWADVAHPPTDEDGSVAVLHVLRFADDGLHEHMEKYTEAAADVAVPHGVRIGGWFGVEGTIVGDGRQWDQVRFNLFPSKAAFMAVVFDPERIEVHKDHREPALADTYTMILRPQIDRMGASIGT
ncbi:MAG: hypothetical protein JWM05_1164 [Acidimicrobiales bacterium]|nr:hypothetical protein [Acidimicrobiales bacterium]